MLTVKTITESRQIANETAKDISRTYLHGELSGYFCHFICHHFCLHFDKFNTRQIHERTQTENNINQIEHRNKYTYTGSIKTMCFHTNSTWQKQLTRNRNQEWTEKKTRTLQVMWTRMKKSKINSNETMKNDEWKEIKIDIASVISATRGKRRNISTSLILWECWFLVWKWQFIRNCHFVQHQKLTLERNSEKSERKKRKCGTKITTKCGSCFRYSVLNGKQKCDFVRAWNKWKYYMCRFDWKVVKNCGKSVCFLANLFRVYHR